jgi:hypothetical protein
MPVHDWTRVDAGLFHSFHQRWIGALCDALNAGGLPPAYFALAEQSIRGPIPDVLTLRLSPGEGQPTGGTSPALAVAAAPPRARVVRSTEGGVYARRADRVTVRHRHGQIVAIVEVVSPGNKGANSELRAFVEKVSDLIQNGVHALVVDVFPPTRRDPQGIHKAIWDEFEDEDFSLPADKPLTVAAYSAGAVKTAYVEPFAVGDELPVMPLFLEPELYVPVSLEDTYRTSWDVFPAALKGLLEASDGHEDRPAGL